jgi:GT2 family glycosyltransferase
MPAKVVDVDVARAWPAIDTGPYPEAFVLVRLDGRPVGTLRVRSAAGKVEPSRLRRAVEEDPEVASLLAEQLFWSQLSGRPPRPAVSARPSFTIVVCTRDRPAELRRCLESLAALCLANGEVLVVDNGSGGDAAALAAHRWGFRCEREPTPGLNAARRRAARHSAGEILLFVDDDAVVDAGWLDAMLEPFSEPLVGAVTGLALPLELETDAQELFERYSSFSRGFRRRVFDMAEHPPAAAGQAGAGVSMAIRRDLLSGLQLFAPELDAGTDARSGGDHYALSRVLASGYRIVYQPEALVWHLHRRDYEAMKRTVAGYSTGVYVVLTRLLLHHRDLQAAKVGWEWFRTHHLHELRRSLMRAPGAAPVDLVVAEMRAVLEAPAVYLRTRRAELARGDR